MVTTRKVIFWGRPIMGKQKWFKREILERFMDEKEMEDFEASYFRAKIINIGKEKLGKSPYIF